tara:strand:+ start:2059 stop:2715 length:657 start_codon:yes stop_codon:yes gene_type:complete
MSNAVVIAGINSAIGISIASEFLNRNVQVIGLTRKNENNYFENSLYTQINKFNYSDLSDLLNLEFNMFINCIGKYSDLTFKDLNKKEIVEMYQSNLILPSVIILEVFNKFLNQDNGYIVNINSVAALSSNPDNEIIYSSSKAGLKTLIESLQTEVANHKSNVRIVDVFSGAFKSNITKKRNDYSKLIDPNEIGALLVSQILNRNSFIQDKIYIKRDIY